MNPKPVNLKVIVAQLEALVDATKQLAPTENHKPVFGVRSYTQTFRDNEWEAILQVLKGRE